MRKRVEVSKKDRNESPLFEGEVVDSQKKQPDQVVVNEHTFWDRLAWLRLSVEEKANITESILEEIQGTPLYWIQLIISVVIVTFGLLQNSVAVIIGGMLIAPLLRPIKGLAFGITTGQPRFFWKAVILQFLTIVMSVFTAYVFSLMIPLKMETSEILARTSPNLLDLFIAIASGTIAMLSLYFKKLSETVAGVAMAAALLPPLAVVGIELSLSNSAAAGGGAFLFLTNLCAILAVGVIIFLFYGFSPYHSDKKNVSVRVVAILFALLIYISFPLFASLKNISDSIELRSQTSDALISIFEEYIPEANLSSIDIIDFKKDSVKFSGIVKLEEGSEFPIGDKREILKELSNRLGREVRMELEIVPVVSMP